MVGATLLFANSVHAQKTVFVGRQTNGETRLTLGFRAESNITERVAIEWSVSYNPSTDVLPELGGAESRQLFFSPSLLVNIIPRRPVVPYVVVGYGVVADILKGSDDEFDDSSTEVTVGRTIHFGGGLKYYFTDTIGVKFDVRRYDIDPDSFVSIQDENGNGEGNGNGEENGGAFDFPSFRMTEFTVGLVWGF